VTAPPDPLAPEGAPSFEGWVAARAPALGRLAYALTGSLDEADAVLQDGLASARLRWARIAADPEAEAAVQAMVVRAYLAHRGRRDRHRDRASLAPADVDLGPWSGAGSVPAAPVEPETRAVWDRCAALTRRQRAVLVLRCLSGLAPDEIAAVAGLRRRVVAAELDTALAAAAPARAGRTGGEPRRRDLVRQTLEEYADSAPPPHDAAVRASTLGMRRRRRRRVVGLTAAAALALPLAWAVATPAEPPADTAALGAEPQLRAPAPVDTGSWRWESWGGVQLQVPRGWGHEDLTQWCVTRGPDGPAVDRPELRGSDAVCSLGDDGRPTYTGGVLLRQERAGIRLSRADVAPYATTRIHTVGDVTITVVDIDPAVGSAILASAEVVGRRDYNGCRPERTGPRPAAARRSGATVDDVAEVASVSVCRYAVVGWRQPTLVSSRRLDGAGARRLHRALLRAPEVAERPTASGCGREREFAVLELWRRGATAGAVSVVVRYDACRVNGVHDGRTSRRLTTDVLRPVLVPPWSGHVRTDVRLPRRARQTSR
jgi:DNA-directed RNA polymerase specialized sigma24 family protein